ncbi:hypothetical protein M758_7G178000 [Ceratodon purpureus]|uniref:Uncharacterized protein n=1 Tax=Ceratodon purpureus TaxID=3225 RepID=A0A8T0HCJ2_CERPU|nr:hypothetical protein KC19_7G180600 [Ceratodon purpureus]KAG0611938.1 hypothetical protein M758_7G178000 [Ceratodon purpureus]
MCRFLYRHKPLGIFLLHPGIGSFLHVVNQKQRSDASLQLPSHSLPLRVMSNLEPLRTCFNAAPHGLCTANSHSLWHENDVWDLVGRLSLAATGGFRAIQGFSVCDPHYVLAWHVSYEGYVGNDLIAGWTGTGYRGSAGCWTT